MPQAQLFKFKETDLFCHRLDGNKLGLRVQISRFGYKHAYARLVKLYPLVNNASGANFASAINYEIARALDLGYSPAKLTIAEIEHELKQFGKLSRVFKAISQDHRYQYYFYEFEPAESKIITEVVA